MALSHQATTVAILRKILGPIHGQEKRFAKIAGKSVSWVKKVSAGITPLSEESARVLEAETEIGLAWLMDGDTRKPPVSASGKPYTFKSFQSHRAALEAGDLKRIGMVSLVRFLPTIAAIGSAAGRKGKVSLFHWRLKSLLNECEDEFGFDKAAETQVMSEIKQAKLPYMAVHDAWKGSSDKASTTFGISRMDPDHIFDVENQSNTHPSKKS